MSRSFDPVTIARELIRCPSVTPDEGGALAYIEHVLTGVGFTVERVVFKEPGSPDVENLYARIGDQSPHLVFAGHTDVVPPGNADAWSYQPFGGEIAGGMLYGRGAVDMKGAIAAFMAATCDYIQTKGKPKGSISFLITGDEEGVAVNGTIKLLKWAAERNITFSHCLLGEPTNVDTLGDTIKIGRRGSLNGTLIVDGTQGHVAYPDRADNPIRGLIKLIDHLLAEPLDQGTDHFDPSNLEFTSVDVGNQTVNVIPAQARARFNIRFNDRHTQESLKELLRVRCITAAKGRVRWWMEFEPSNSDVFVTKPGPFVDLVVSAVESTTGRKPALSTSGGTSDARFIKNYCPVVEFGLLGQTMHQVDERTAVSELEQLARIYRTILDTYFAGI
ncbi:MAG TPA: succinyl-diaminopimelate desuccinylase [Xanthobacteraceae bacterium]|jgi:succinyl-diaminopimelate desuccinylase|nr:succinyl-diaminopimelate desuccinylase [Xanthobacteraceae bacterium]